MLVIPLGKVIALQGSDGKLARARVIDRLLDYLLGAVDPRFFYDIIIASGNRIPVCHWRTGWRLWHGNLLGGYRWWWGRQRGTLTLSRARALLLFKAAVILLLVVRLRPVFWGRVVAWAGIKLALFG